MPKVSIHPAENRLFNSSSIDHTMKPLVILLIAAYSSCLRTLPGETTASAFYKLDDISVRMIMKFPEDTLYRSYFDLQENKPGEYYRKLSTTSKLDTAFQLGVLIKFWANMVKKGTSIYYAEFPKYGL
jgi:hypothetical protein